MAGWMMSAALGASDEEEAEALVAIDGLAVEVVAALLAEGVGLELGEALEGALGREGIGEEVGGVGHGVSVGFLIGWTAVQGKYCGTVETRRRGEKK
jgi:hypothetical protein